MEETKMSLKLLIDTKAKRVLFAEAGKDFVDFLFHMFSLPLGTVAKLLTTIGMAGSLVDLAKSVQALSSDYFQHNVTQGTVLQPRVITSVAPPLSLLSDIPNSQDTNNFFRCSTARFPECTYYFTGGTKANCPKCSARMCIPMRYVKSKSSSEVTPSSSCNCSVGGYVKGATTYMVMDNLEVKPMSAVSSISLLNNFNVKDVSSLVEKQVVVGFDEGIALLKASLESQAVLTTVFKHAIETGSTLEDQETNKHKNALETYLKDTVMKLHGIYSEFATPLEKAAFLSLLRQVDSWLLDEGRSETKRVYIVKLDELKKQGYPIVERYKEHIELATFIDQFNCRVKYYQDSATSNDPKFDHIDLSEKKKVLKACTEAKSWIKEKKKQQLALPKHMTPVLRSFDLVNKGEEIDRFCRPIMTKPPKPAIKKRRRSTRV